MVTINVIDQAPVAYSATYAIPVQPALVLHQAGLGTADADRDPLQAVLVSDLSAVAGTLTLHVDGAFTFIPADTFKGTTSFTYQVTDGANLSAPATVTIQVTGADPTALAHSYSVYHDQTLSVGLSQGLLQGASGPVPSSLTAVIVTPPAHGTLAANPDGSFTYTPQANFAGTDTFTYQAQDAFAASSAVQTVTIIVQDILYPWWARETSTAVFRTAQPGDPISGNLFPANARDYDGDPLTVSLGTFSFPDGTLTLNSAGSFSYSGGSGGWFDAVISDGLTTTTERVFLSYSGEDPGGENTLTTNIVLNPGQEYGNPGSPMVWNYGPGVVQILSYSAASATVGPVSGTNFYVEIQQGSGTWSGDVSGSLLFLVQGDVSDLSISGDLSVSSQGTIGNLSGRNVGASGANVGNITATQDINVSFAIPSGGLNEFTGGAIGNLSGRNVMAYGTSVGNITATEDISVNTLVLTGGAPVSTSGAIGNLSGRNVGASGVNIGNITATQSVSVNAFVPGADILLGVSSFPKCLPHNSIKSLVEFPPPQPRAPPARREDLCPTTHPQGRFRNPSIPTRDLPALAIRLPPPNPARNTTTAPHHRTTTRPTLHPCLVPIPRRLPCPGWLPGAWAHAPTAADHAANVWSSPRTHRLR
jgi:VCBS repeat-containing protein